MLVVGCERPIKVCTIALLMMRVGLLHTGYVGRLAGLAVVGAAALGKLDEQAGTVADGDVVLDDTHTVTVNPYDTISIVNNGGVTPVDFLLDLNRTTSGCEENV